MRAGLQKENKCTIIVDMNEEAGKIYTDRTEGTSHGSGNPSVVLSRDEFRRFLSKLASRGIRISSSTQAEVLFSTVGLEGVMPFVSFARCHTASGTVSLSAVTDLVRLEGNFRRTVLDAILVIELQAKAQYRNCMSEMFGQMCLYNRECFSDEAKHEVTLSIIEREVARRLRGGARCGAVPLGTALNYASLGTLSKLLSNTESSVAVASVSSSFGVDVQSLVSWLRTLTAARNCFAHLDPYVVKRQIPSAPLSVAGLPGDNAAPLYILLVIDEMLRGRARYLGRDDGALGRFELDAAGALESFAKECPSLAESLRVPREFLARADARRLGERLAWRRGPVAYRVVAMAA